MESSIFLKEFTAVAEQAGVPHQYRGSFAKELESYIDDPRAATRVAEKWLSMFDFNWPAGAIYLIDYQGEKRLTAKGMAKAFAHYIIGRYRNASAHARYARVTKSHPYVIVRKGTTIKPCPVHKDDYEQIFLFEDSYFDAKPLRQSVFCRCWLRSVAHHEYERLIQNGYKPVAPKNNKRYW